MIESVRFGVLGPLEVQRDGHVVPVRAGQQRVVLAVLLLRANRTVPMSQLVDRLWDESTPADARGTVQKYVMRLRRVLAEVGWEGLRTEPGGYRIEVATGQLDLERFEDLVRAGTRAGEAGDAACESAVLGKAFALWRGVPPLSNVASESLQRHEVPWLLERYLHVIQRRIKVDLQLGRGAELIGELTGLVRDYPLRERLWVQRMRALHQAGRQGEALQAYREVTRLLADELGVDPGPELRAAHEEILRAAEPSPAPRVSGSDRGHRGDRPAAVRQLPMAAGGFVGREVELEQIVHGLVGAGSAAAPVVVVTGPAGVGKTTLAVQAAHGVAEQFGDGQLFADLRGYAPAAPLSVEEVLGQFLRGSGMAPEAVPLSRDDQVLAYRSLLAGRHMLVVLDNVGSVEDVRALLPGAP
ncbi:MAG: DNA-binding transcriptional activator of the family, partial [Pseudonocardia sp.]|nr:DNA-binding transcriptional activator of the family [Pseudonocardia sp.]